MKPEGNEDVDDKDAENADLDEDIPEQHDESFIEDEKHKAGDKEGSLSERRKRRRPKRFQSETEEPTEKISRQNTILDIRKPLIVTKKKLEIKVSQSLLKEPKCKKKRTAKPQICNLCGITTTNLYGLKNHLANVHNEGARYTCAVCQKGFLQRMAYEDHVNAHAGRKTYSCHLCGISTPYSVSYRRHMQQHRVNPNRVKVERPFHCNDCSSQFKSMLNLKEHISREHLMRRIHCGCGQTFKWRSAFARHKDKCSESHNCQKDPSPFQRTPKKTTKKSQQQETRERLQSLIASQGPMTVSSVITTKLSPEKILEELELTPKFDDASTGLQVVSKETVHVSGKSQNVKESSDHVSQKKCPPEDTPNGQSTKSVSISSKFGTSVGPL